MKKNNKTKQSTKNPEINRENLFLTLEAADDKMIKLPGQLTDFQELSIIAHSLNAEICISLFWSFILFKP